MPVPQITLFLSSDGKSVLAEAPGRNGSREKITLPSDFAFHNPIIVAALKVQARQEKAIRAEVDRAKVLAKRVDPAVERQARIEAEKAERLRKWNALSVKEQERQIAANLEAAEKRKEEAASRKRRIWNYTASEYTNGVELANRVIPNPSERPNRLFKIAGTLGSFSPRTFTGDTSKPTYIKKPSKAGQVKVIPGIKVTL